MNSITSETVFAMISLIASVASLALAVIAIWIALYGKREAEQTNQKTQDLLTEVRSDAKSIAQYAIPELRAYGDSVRKFVFEKRKKTDYSSSTLLSKVEEILTENINIIRGELVSIREEKDVSAVKRKIDHIEEQIRSSQEIVRNSVKDLSQEWLIEVTHNGEEKWEVPVDHFRDFIKHLDINDDYKIVDYNTLWTILEPKSGSKVSGKHIHKKTSFFDLGFGEIQRFNLVDLV